MVNSALLEVRTGKMAGYRNEYAILFGKTKEPESKGVPKQLECP